MTDKVIGEIEKKPVQYLLWSNRTYPDYGTPVFGRDYNQELGVYLTSHYQPIGPLVPNSNVGVQTNSLRGSVSPANDAALAPGDCGAELATQAITRCRFLAGLSAQLFAGAKQI